MKCDKWHVTCDTHLTGDVWHMMWTLSKNSSSLALALMSIVIDRGVCRIATATPGRLNTVYPEP